MEQVLIQLQEPLLVLTVFQALQQLALEALQARLVFARLVIILQEGIAKHVELVRTL